MSDERLDRIERKINRIGSIVIVMAVTVLIVVAVTLTRYLNVSLSHLQLGLLLSFGALVMLSLRQPFRN